MRSPTFGRRATAFAAMSLTLAATLLAGCLPASEPSDSPTLTPLTPGALPSPAPTDEYAAWRDDLPRMPDGRYLVDDMPYRDGPALREIHARRQAAAAGLGTHDGGLAYVDWAWGTWNGDEKVNLSYCITHDLGWRYEQVRTAMNEAARAWESVADVRFIHRPEFDADCTNDTPVEFNVRAECADDPDDAYGASAFFPWYYRWEQELLICDFLDVNFSPMTLSGVLKHELGHILGFHHEHDREECNDDQIWSEGLTAYDAMSVMHYRGQCGSSAAYDYYLTAQDRAGAGALYGAHRTERVALRAGDGHFLQANSGGWGTLRADADRVGPWETFELVHLGDGKVAVRAWGGSRRYLRAQQGGPGKLTFDAWQVGPQTTFTLTEHWGGKISLRAHSGAYLAAHGNGGGAMSASTYGWASTWNRFEVVHLEEQPVALESAAHAGSYLRWTRTRNTDFFTQRVDRRSSWFLVDLGDDEVALRTADGLYLAAENGGGSILRANRDIVGPWETFTRVDHPDGTTSFRSHSGAWVFAFGNKLAGAHHGSSASANARFRLRRLDGDETVALRAPNGRYVAAEGGGGGTLRANRYWVKDWERFRIVELSGGRVALRTAIGTFVSAEGGGGGALRARADWIDVWETFERVPLSGKRFALRTHSGHFVRAIGGGGAILDAKAKKIGPWERFWMPAK